MTKDSLFKRIQKLNNKLELLRYQELLCTGEIEKINRKLFALELEFDLTIEKKHFSANQALKNYYFAELCKEKKYTKDQARRDKLKLQKSARGIDIKTANNSIDLLKLKVGSIKE